MSAMYNSKPSNWRAVILSQSKNPRAEPSLSGWDGISAHYMPPSKMLIITQCCDVLPNNLLNYADVACYVDSVKYAKAILYG